jgi:uncharacterized protein (TIGR03435 family)
MRHLSVRSGGTIFLAAAAFCAPLFSQTSFEAVSIKPNDGISRSSTESKSPGRITANNIPFSAIVESAFGIRGFQILNAPGWLSRDTYDLSIKTGTLKDLNEEEIRPYLRSLLADRLHLQYHRERREGQVYSLIPAKGGAKLTPHSGDGDPATNMSSRSGKIFISCTNVSMTTFASTVSGQLERPVLNNTGLEGGYDFKLTFAGDPAPGSTEPSLLTALQEQLGLKLESTKGPVDYIVIDRLDKPSAN